MAGFVVVVEAAYWRAGKLPPGTMLRSYFAGREAEVDGGFTFGLTPPSAPSTPTSSWWATARCRGRSPSWGVS